MALYSILYLDPVNAPGKKVEYRLEAASDAQARIRFMNLSWVAFTAITIDSVAVAFDQPEEAKRAAKADPLAGVKPHPYRGVTPGPCRECRQPFGHKIHRGHDAVFDDPEDRTHAAGKRGAVAVKAAAAGIAPPADDRPPLMARGHAGRPSRPAPPPPPKPVPASDWQKDVDHLTDRIGKLADRAQSLTRRGRHAEADELRKEARELAASRAAITKRNKRK